MNNELHDILGDLTLHLLERGLLEHPIQIASAKFERRDASVCYILFTSDIFPILNYVHPVLINKDMDTAVNDLEFLKEVPKNYKQVAKKYSADFSLNKQVLIRDRYELLKKISVSKSILSELYEKCISQNISQSGTSLNMRNIEYVSTSIEGELLCKLEKILFCTEDYPFYQCTFFDFNERNPEVIYSILTFCPVKKNRDIGEAILEYLRNTNKLILLEDFPEEYNLEKQENTSKPNWTAVHTEFKSILAIQEKHQAHNNSKPFLRHTINELNTLISKIEEIENVPDEMPGEKIRLCAEFLKKEQNNVGTPEYINKLKELIGQL